jgi:hypothetical protein
MKPRKTAAENSNARRSEVVTVRLDPRLKYLAEIAARKQRRTLSGYIEWAVEQSLQSVVLRERNDFTKDLSVADAQQKIGLWEVDEAERVARLAQHFPELLSYEEQLIWRLIRDCGLLWKGKFSPRDGQWEWSVSDSDLILERLREHWEIFKKVALGGAPKSELPKWQKYDMSKVKPDASKGEMIDDDIPF